jgi:hypothetical protein
MRSRSSDNAKLFEDMAMPVALVSVFRYVLFLFSTAKESIGLMTRGFEGGNWELLAKV